MCFIGISVLVSNKMPKKVTGIVLAIGHHWLFCVLFVISYSPFVHLNGF